MTARRTQRALAMTLARRLQRVRGLLATAATTVFVAAFGLLTMLMFLHGQALSGPRLAERDLGRFDSTIGFGGLEALPGSDVARDLAQRLGRVHGLDDFAVALVAADFPVPRVSLDGIFYKEMTWTEDPFPGRYELIGGRFPGSSGEIALADVDSTIGIAVGDTVNILSGDTQLRVVGIIDDEFSSQPAVLAGTGTWEALPGAAAEGYALLRASPIAYWSGSNPSAVRHAVAAVYRKHGAQRQALGEALSSSYTTRAVLETRGEKSWVLKSPAGYLLSWLLPPLAVTTCFGIVQRRVANSIRLMTAIGVSRRTAVTGGWTAIFGWCLVACVAGAIVGVASGFAAARFVAHVADNPRPIWDLPAMTLLRLLMGVAVGGFAGFLMLLWASVQDSSHSHAAHRVQRRRARDARQLVGLAAVCAAVLQLRKLDSPPRAMVLAATVAIAVLAATPDIVSWVIRRVPGTGLRARLSKRQLLADHSRAVTAVSVVALLLGTSLGFIALLDTMIRTAGAYVYPEVAPRQVMLADRRTDVAPVPDLTARAARSFPALRNQEPVQLRYVGHRESEFVTQLRAGGELGLILALDSPEEVARLTQRPIDATRRDVLASSGILLWRATTAVSKGVVEFHLVNGDRIVKTFEGVPAATFDVPAYGWNEGTTGVILTRTAQTMGLPITNGAVVFTDISDDDARRVLEGFSNAGVDPETARIYEPPPPPVPPVALYATAIGLAAIVLLVTTAATKSQVTALRDRLVHLLALGLSRRWARQVIVHQHALMLALATVLGIVIAVPPVVFAVALIPGFVLSIPWTQMLVLVFATYFASFAAIFVATRRLTTSATALENAGRWTRRRTREDRLPRRRGGVA